MKNPKISIIIPIYNAEIYLEECINSLLKQSYKNFEAILINDGSTDGSFVICNRYAELHSNFKLINQENQGVDKARNRGLEAAQGEYITFIDSDDWAEKEWLQIYMNEADRHPECDLLVQGSTIDYITRQNRVALPGKIYKGQSVIDGLSLLEKHFISGFTHNKMYKSSLINGHELSFRYTFKEDLLFNLRYLSYIQSLSIISESPYHYMQRSGDSLIKRRYPARYMQDLSTELRDSGLKLADKYNSSAYAQFTMERYFNSYIALIASLYKKPFNNYSKKERKEYIKRFKKEKKESNIKMVPEDKNKLYFDKILTLPFLLCDLLFSSIFKFISS